MKIPFFDLKRQNAGFANEINAAFGEVFESGQFILGSQVAAFEEAFAAYTGAKRCVTCGNGTDALEMALHSLGVGQGDEVIVPAFGWISPATAANKVGAKPVFADIDLVSYNVTTSSIASKINAKTKAIIVIHLYGTVCEIESIAELCKSHNLLLIEDCAQAHGARVGGKHVGLYGDIGTFSFYPTKNLGCLGDGGCIITNDDEFANQISKLRNYGRSNGKFQLDSRNSRLDELQAAILLKKLPLLNQWNDRRKEIAGVYDKALNPRFAVGNKAGLSVYYQYPILSENRMALKNYLSENGVETDIHYLFTVPEALSMPNSEKYPNAELVRRQVLSLPIFPELTDEEVFYIAQSVQNFMISTN